MTPLEAYRELLGLRIAEHAYLDALIEPPLARLREVLAEDHSPAQLAAAEGEPIPWIPEIASYLREEAKPGIGKLCDAIEHMPPEDALELLDNMANLVAHSWGEKTPEEVDEELPDLTAIMLLREVLRSAIILQAAATDE